MFHGGGPWGGGPPGRGPGGPSGSRLSSALDAGEENELGKIYDAGVLKKLPGYMSWVKKALGLGITGTILRTLTALVMPILVRDATNEIIAGRTSILGIIALVYLAVALIQWGGQFLETLNLSYASQGILFRMRKQLFSHLQSLSLGFYDANKVGKLMSRVQNDVDQLQTLVTQDIINILANGLTLIAIAVVMMLMNLHLALIALAVVPVLILIIIIWQRRARRAFLKVRQKIAIVNDQLQEGISGVRVTQSLSRERENLRQFDTANKEHLDANVEAARLQAFMMPVNNILTNTAYSLVLVFGGFQVLEGKTDVGTIVAFLLYVQRFFMPVMELIMLYTQIQRAMASASRIFELLDVNPLIQDRPHAENIPAVKGEIRFDHVSFSYIPGTEVLHDLDFTIEPGRTVAIAGRTGAGKSSLTNLITRFYDVSEGSVLIDSYDVRSVTQESLRRQISVVPQDPFLFSGSIESNIKYGRTEATHEEVIEAAKAAGAHEFIKRLEHGYDTMVGERGGSLSAGQRQLICLARAILLKPPIIILDEATSSVDTDTERIMQASLHSMSGTRTCVIIAHRLSTITEADNIIFLEHGRIVESGSHSELIARKGTYYHMYETLSGN
ncbi:MAG: ABC transporter ATP-binding protein [Dehalococcoidales bacterium]|nr:ABC transporter ATP-binding protein [Dehalococcoidales bacterium]